MEFGAACREFGTCCSFGRVAEALVQVLPCLMPLRARFFVAYNAEFLSRMRAKLGLVVELSSDGELIAALLDAMAATSCDFTNTFR
jgi:uncharacterized protein YdiU (UPF0061 family)